VAGGVGICANSALLIFPEYEMSVLVSDIHCSFEEWFFIDSFANDQVWRHTGAHEHPGAAAFTQKLRSCPFTQKRTVRPMRSF